MHGFQLGDRFVRGGYWRKFVFQAQFDTLLLVLNTMGDTLGEQTISFLSRERYFSRISWSSLDSGLGNRVEIVWAKVSGE